VTKINSKIISVVLAYCSTADRLPQKLTLDNDIQYHYLFKWSLDKLLRVALLFKEGFECSGMFWLGMSRQDVLIDVNESKEVWTVIFTSTTMNLQIPETCAERYL